VKHDGLTRWNFRINLRSRFAKKISKKAKTPPAEVNKLLQKASFSFSKGTFEKEIS
jgi:hypothetical protein